MRNIAARFPTQDRVLRKIKGCKVLDRAKVVTITLNMVQVNTLIKGKSISNLI